MYYVKVGDENTKIPECCDKCYMCQNRFELCESCALLIQYWDLIPKKEYHCIANFNQRIQDISKKPDWCPIVEVKDG